MKEFNIVLFIILVGLPFQNTQAQKLKDKKVKIAYISLPAQEIPEGFNTYSVNVSGSAISQAGMKSSSAASQIKMDGYRRITDGQRGHLHASVGTGYVTLGRADYQSETRTKKDKDDNETKTTYYWYNFPVSSNSYYKIINTNNDVLFSNEYPVNKIVKSREYTNYSSLRKAYSGIAANIKKSAAKDCANTVIRAANQALAEQFDFKVTYDHPIIYRIAKYDDDEKWERHFTEAHDIFKQAPANMSAAELEEKLKGGIEFWKSKASTNHKKDKKLMRVYEAANYNMAVMCYYTDHLDLAKTYTDNLLSMDQKNGRAKRLVKSIERSQQRMDLHGIHTMHHSRDLSNAVPPADVTAFEETQDAIASSNDMSTGVVFTTDAEINGEFILEKGSR